MKSDLFLLLLLLMINLCLLTNSLERLQPRLYSDAWKQFCDNLRNCWIEVISCPVDTRDQEANEFIHNGLHARPDIIWYRSSHEVSWDFTSLGSSLFVEYCRDKRKTYQTLLSYHPITYLGSEYFSLSWGEEYIVKPRYGQRKQWIERMKGSTLIDRDYYMTDQWIIQDYKQTWYQRKWNHDIRCVMLGNQIVGSFIRWWSDPLGSRKKELIILADGLQTWVHKRAKKLLLKTKTQHALYSIDIGIDAKTWGPFVIECNSAIGIPSLLTVDPTWEIIAKYLKSMLY